MMNNDKAGDFISIIYTKHGSLFTLGRHKTDRHTRTLADL